MTPGQLVKAVAMALDVPEETVTQHDRNLVVAGLRTKGGRGRSAPDVTPSDAARLLVATVGSIRTKDSVRTLVEFENTKYRRLDMDWAKLIDHGRAQGIVVTDEEEKSLLDSRSFSDPAITALAPDHNFVQAIASLISHASAPVADLDLHLVRFSEISIECNSPFIRAHIGKVGGGSAAYGRPTPKTAPTPLTQPRHERYAQYYGILQRRSFYGSAIMLLGKAFRDGGLPFKSAKDAIDALTGKKVATKSRRKVV
jgi:hypothetical protein